MDTASTSNYQIVIDQQGIEPDQSCAYPSPALALNDGKPHGGYETTERPTAA